MWSSVESRKVQEGISVTVATIRLKYLSIYHLLFVFKPLWNAAAKPRIDRMAGTAMYFTPTYFTPTYTKKDHFDPASSCSWVWQSQSLLQHSLIHGTLSQGLQFSHALSRSLSASHKDVPMKDLENTERFSRLVSCRSVNISKAVRMLHKKVDDITKYPLVRLTLTSLVWFNGCLCVWYA